MVPTPTGGATVSTATPVAARAARAVRARAVLALSSGLVGLTTLGCSVGVVIRSVAPDLAVTGIDADVTAALTDNRAAWLTTLNLAASWLGSLPVVGVVVVALGVTAGVRSGRWHLLWVPGFAGAGALVISGLVKAFTDRARPPQTTALVEALGLAFPSGHALRAIAVYGALAWLVTAVTRRPVTRTLVWAGAAALIVAVGFSRIYLGAHWLTDVLAGCALGAAWLALVLAITTARRAPQRAPDGGARRRAVVAVVPLVVVVGAGCGELQPARDEAPQSPPSPPVATPDERDPGTPAPAADELAVHFIDAGQGDATLLVAPDATVLVDAGRHTATDVVDYLQRSGITAIDVVAVTHPHADHIGQFDLVMERFDVAEVWWSPATHTTQTFDRALGALEASAAAYEEPAAGDRTEVGTLRFEFVNPGWDAAGGDLHEHTLAFRVTYGDVAFLFTGDAEQDTEARMVATMPDLLAADVYQVGHHGSSTSTSQAFLAAVAPKVAVYSAGRDSQYGHPHEEIVDRLVGSDTAVYGTAVHGTVVVTTDGTDLHVRTATDAPPLRAGDRP